MARRSRICECSNCRRNTRVNWQSKRTFVIVNAPWAEKIVRLVCQTAILIVFFPMILLVFERMACVYCYKKTIKIRDVTQEMFFGHTKRMPRFQHKSLFAVRLLFWNQLRFFCLKNPSFSHMALGAPPWNPKFLRHRNTGKAKEKARYFAGFPVYSPQIFLLKLCFHRAWFCVPEVIIP